MIPPKVVNIKKVFGQATIYIGHGSEYANSFAHDKISRARKLKLFEDEWRMRLELAPTWWRPLLRRLGGQVLGCHCSPKPCHGDILRKLFVEQFMDGKIEVQDGQSLRGNTQAPGGEMGQ